MSFINNKISIILCLFLSQFTACSLLTPGTNLLGRVFFSDAGGYEVQLVNDYTFKENESGFEMLSPGSEPLIGPGFIGIGGLIEEERTNEDLWNSVTLDEYKNYQFDTPKTRKINGISGLIAEFTGSQDEISVRGKIYIAMVNEKQPFVLIGFYPEDEWRRFEPLYDRVLGTVKFYIPNRSVIFDNPYRRDINEDEFTSPTMSGDETEVVP